MTATKLPMREVPLVNDNDLAAAIGRILEPYEGEELREAQIACREVHASAVLGPFSEILAAYQAKIDERIRKVRARKPKS